MSGRRGSRYGGYSSSRGGSQPYDIPEDEAVDGPNNPFNDSQPRKADQGSTNPFDTGFKKARPKAPASNPFDEEPRQSSSNPFDEGPAQPRPVRRASSNPFDEGPSQRSRPPPPARSNPFDEEPSSTNPFGDEPDVKPVPQQKRVPAAPVANLFGGDSTEEDKVPILSAVDAEDKPKLSRPSSITNRARTTGSTADDGGSKTTAAFKSWLQGNKDKDRRFPNPMLSSRASGQAVAPKNAPPNKKGKGKRCTFSKWPFDDYHKAQEKFYEELDAKANEKAGNDSGAAVADEYERPAELVDIHTAVQGLSLADFERKAEERAIGLVSTWLYDAGLIDELLDYKASAMPSSAASVSESSTKTSEGVEIGAQGVPLEGSQRMDAEVEKFRTSTQRELSLINARLNEGVAASGSEVQELVDAVNSTKSDLGRLRELALYISNGGELEKKATKFELAKYPKLKALPNARRNLQRVFRDLQFFSKIPVICHDLREELNSGEYTAEEWTTIRNVCMEHVELEILLVEAEAGMKARAEVEENEDMRASSHARASFRGSSFRNLSKTNYYEHIDRFLAPHVKNVWELGDEIRVRVLSGIGAAFELALNNPAGMVALVEAVEVYERAEDEFRAIHGDSNSEKDGLQFTDMRAAALAQICQDFELRSLEVFRQIQMQAADVAEEDEDIDTQMNAVLRAATELVYEIDQVKNRISPCFPPYWGVELVWSTSVAKVCSRQILQQIGGPDAQRLPRFTVTQLLDLMAWVEHFRETVEEGFPDIGSVSAKRTYYDDKPDLLADNNREVDAASAKDMLAWANNTLWDVHRLATDEFISRTREQTEAWVEKAYAADHTKNQSPEGRLTTSLPEDVYGFAGVQLRTIQERLSRKSDALVLAAHLIFGQLRLKQIHTRDAFMEDLETSCAAANDCLRMGEKLEEIVAQIKENATFSDDYIEAYEVSTEELLTLYGRDAVFAAGSVHIYVFEPIRDEIAGELFGTDWEEHLTHNDLAKTLVVTLEDFMGDLDQYLEPMLLRKAVDAFLKGSIAFYITCLLTKSENHNNNKNSVFIDNTRALARMTGDINVMRDYFDGLAGTMPALGRVIEREFEFLTTVHELLSIAAGLSSSDASDFIIVLHKRICDINITKNLVGDLWHLVNPAEERLILEEVDKLEDELTTIAPRDENAVHQSRDHHTVPGLRLDEVIATVYLKSKRRRPDKSGVTKVIETWKPPPGYKDFRQRGEEIRQEMGWSSSEVAEE